MTKNDTLKLALKGMDSEAFGNLRALVVDTREEALALIRQAMADST